MKVAAATLRYGKLCIGLLALEYVAPAVGATATIYRCGGEPAVYSDRPCGTDATPHTIDDTRVTVYEAHPPSAPASSARLKKPASRPAKAGRNAAASDERRQAKCNKLDQSLRDVRTRMRTGYGVEEGERLKARQRRLSQERRLQKCG